MERNTFVLDDDIRAAGTRSENDVPQLFSPDSAPAPHRRLAVAVERLERRLSTAGQYLTPLSEVRTMLERAHGGEAGALPEACESLAGVLGELDLLVDDIARLGLILSTTRHREISEWFDW
ncbi:hypothetical protein [Nocardia brasiliensis]|uniref:hypothetical protein n=1 Tax=Nocardia brasiliensis TaxID=37326 RepID=UPI00366B770A